MDFTPGIYDFEEIIGFVNEHRTSKDQFDVVLMGQSKGGSEEDSWIEDYKAAGVNWYVELVYDGTFEKILERIQRKPPSY